MTTTDPEDAARRMLVPVGDVVYFAHRALDGMAGIVRELGDELANARPSLPGANTPYALLEHCLGVVEYWAGHLVHGRPSARVRESEFTRSGPVDALLERVEEAKAQLRRDVESASATSPLVNEPTDAMQGPARALTQGGAVQHVYEELAQHHGQMELMRDVIVAEHEGRLEVRS